MILFIIVDGTCSCPVLGNFGKQYKTSGGPETVCYFFTLSSSNSTSELVRDIINSSEKREGEEKERPDHADESVCEEAAPV